MTLLDQKEDYYKLEGVGKFSSNNYIEYESNGHKNSNLLLEEYVTKIKPFLRNMILRILIHEKFS